jgi:LCP family protein required for cell wall assembly
MDRGGRADSVFVVSDRQPRQRRASCRSRGRRTLAQRLLIGTNLALMVVALVAAGGFYSARRIIKSFHTVTVEGATRSNASELGLDQPRNFLIIGTDSAARLNSSDPVTNDREGLGLLSDVVMILRIDPKSERAHLLSIPRDTTMEIYPTGNVRRINSAIQGAGGAKDLIQTIKRELGVSIDHYVQVDLYAFKTIVAVLGGVNAYFDTAIYDKNTRIQIDTPGCIKLNQDQALAYARSRHMQFRDPDGEWDYEPTGDTGRVERQQQFVKLIMREAISKGIRNPSTALNIGNAVSQVVITDEQLTVRSMMDLGTQFRTFSADDLVTQIVPTRDYKGPMDAAYQEILWDEAGPILDVYRGVEPGKPVKPRDVIVSVVGTSDLNPTGMAKEMAALGFDASGSVDEDSGRDQTVVRYGEDGGEAAILAARYMDADVDFRCDEEIRGRQVRIVLGSDFKGIRQEPADLSSLSAEELNQLMEATDMVLNAEGEPVTTTTTTTTPVTAPPTTEDPGLVEGETSSSLPAATGESGLEGGPVATGPFATVTTDGGSTPPTTQLEQSSTIEGGFVPIDYQRSLSC